MAVKARFTRAKVQVRQARNARVPRVSENEVLMAGRLDPSYVRNLTS